MAVNHLVKVFFVMAFILHTVIREDIAGAEREHVCFCLWEKACKSSLVYGCNNLWNDKRDESYLNSDSVCEGLEKLWKNNLNAYIYVILDNAAYQRCKKVKQKAAELNINLIFLPSYSPNLNLIERLWKFLRKEILANQYCHRFRDFYSAIESFVKALHENYFEQLSSLLTFRFEVFDSSGFYWFLE